MFGSVPIVELCIAVARLSLATFIYKHPMSAPIIYPLKRTFLNIKDEFVDFGHDIFTCDLRTYIDYFSSRL
jgi:hypothetical protein